MYVSGYTHIDAYVYVWVVYLLYLSANRLQPCWGHVENFESNKSILAHVLKYGIHFVGHFCWTSNIGYEKKNQPPVVKRQWETNTDTDTYEQLTRVLSTPVPPPKWL